MTNALRIIKKILLLFCVVFTLATLASCAINLAWGYATDTYSHILDRAVLTLIGSIVITIILEKKLKNSVLNLLVPYVIFILLAFLYIFILGFFQELHPNAYRDIFLNDTIAYIVVYLGLLVYERHRTNNKS